MTTIMSEPQESSESTAGRGRRRRSPIRWQQQIKRLLKLSEAQVVLGWLVILVLAALLGTLYLVQASNVAETGRRVQVLQIELATTKRENAQLERGIAEAQSLERLQRAAFQMGFVPASPGDIEYIIVPDYPANAPSSATPTPVPTAAPIETIEEALWIALQSRFTDLRRGESREQ